ncbi:hypothetical protein [Caballeronia sp. PC1]|uniref:hypothetical protein n=2 Tax=unclassified Caballeronia TaxID=2646786 RepID=UPI001F485CC6|nr:hypothetical protein [Caballeronia sp. PC1]
MHFNDYKCGVGNPLKENSIRIPNYPKASYKWMRIREIVTSFSLRPVMRIALRERLSRFYRTPFHLLATGYALSPEERQLYRRTRRFHPQRGALRLVSLLKDPREFQTMKKIVAALASAMLVSTAFAQTATTDAGKAQLKANNEKAEAQATANKKKAEAQHDAAKAQASANEDKASAQADANKEAAKVAQATTPEQASDARSDAAKAQAKADKKKHAAQTKADKKKHEASKDANVAQAKADKEKVEAQSDANKAAADAKVDAAKK